MPRFDIQNLSAGLVDENQRGHLSDKYRNKCTELENMIIGTDKNIKKRPAGKLTKSIDQLGGTLLNKIDNIELIKIADSSINTRVTDYQIPKFGTLQSVISLDKFDLVHYKREFQSNSNIPLFLDTGVLAYDFRDSKFGARASRQRLDFTRQSTITPNSTIKDFDIYPKLGFDRIFTSTGFLTSGTNQRLFLIYGDGTSETSRQTIPSVLNNFATNHFDNNRSKVTYPERPEIQIMADVLNFPTKFGKKAIPIFIDTPGAIDTDFTDTTVLNNARQDILDNIKDKGLIPLGVTNPFGNSPTFQAGSWEIKTGLLAKDRDYLVMFIAAETNLTNSTQALWQSRIENIKLSIRRLYTNTLRREIIEIIKATNFNLNSDFAAYFGYGSQRRYLSQSLIDDILDKTVDLNDIPQQFREVYNTFLQNTELVAFFAEIDRITDPNTRPSNLNVTNNSDFANADVAIAWNYSPEGLNYFQSIIDEIENLTIQEYVEQFPVQRLQSRLNNLKAGTIDRNINDYYIIDTDTNLPVFSKSDSDFISNNQQFTQFTGTIDEIKILKDKNKIRFNAFDLEFSIQDGQLIEESNVIAGDPDHALTYDRLDTDLGRIPLKAFENGQEIDIDLLPSELQTQLRRTAFVLTARSSTRVDVQILPDVKLPLRGLDCSAAGTFLFTDNEDGNWFCDEGLSYALLGIGDSLQTETTEDGELEDIETQKQPDNISPPYISLGEYAGREHEIISAGAVGFKVVLQTNNNKTRGNIPIYDALSTRTGYTNYARNNELPADTNAATIDSISNLFRRDIDRIAVTKRNILIVLDYSNKEWIRKTMDKYKLTNLISHTFGESISGGLAKQKSIPIKFSNNNEENIDFNIQNQDGSTKNHDSFDDLAYTYIFKKTKDNPTFLIDSARDFKTIVNPQFLVDVKSDNGSKAADYNKTYNASDDNKVNIIKTFNAIETSDYRLLNDETGMPSTNKFVETMKKVFGNPHDTVLVGLLNRIRVIANKDAIKINNRTLAERKQALEADIKRIKEEIRSNGYIGWCQLGSAGGCRLLYGARERIAFKERQLKTLGLTQASALDNFNSVHPSELNFYFYYMMGLDLDIRPVFFNPIPLRPKSTEGFKLIGDTGVYFDSNHITITPENETNIRNVSFKDFISKNKVFLPNQASDYVRSDFFNAINDFGVTPNGSDPVTFEFEDDEEVVGVAPSTVQGQENRIVIATNKAVYLAQRFLNSRGQVELAFTEIGESGSDIEPVNEGANIYTAKDNIPYAISYNEQFRSYQERRMVDDYSFGKSKIKQIISFFAKHNTILYLTEDSKIHVATMANSSQVIGMSVLTFNFTIQRMFKRSTDILELSTSEGLVELDFSKAEEGGKDLDKDFIPVNIRPMPIVVIQDEQLAADKDIEVRSMTIGVTGAGRFTVEVLGRDTIPISTPYRFVDEDDVTRTKLFSELVYLDTFDDNGSIFPEIRITKNDDDYIEFSSISIDYEE